MGGAGPFPPPFPDDLRRNAEQDPKLFAPDHVGVPQDFLDALSFMGTSSSNRIVQGIACNVPVLGSGVNGVAVLNFRV